MKPPIKPLFALKALVFCLALIPFGSLGVALAFDVIDILSDIAKRPFITVGFTALVLMAPLAATSTNAMLRWLGAKRWLAPHKLVYVISPLGVLHFWWMVKKDVTEPAVYALVLTALLGYRLAAKLIERRRTDSSSSGPVITPRVGLR